MQPVRSLLKSYARNSISNPDAESIKAIVEEVNEVIDVILPIPERDNSFPTKNQSVSLKSYVRNSLLSPSINEMRLSVIAVIDEYNNPVIGKGFPVKNQSFPSKVYVLNSSLTSSIKAILEDESAVIEGRVVDI